MKVLGCFSLILSLISGINVFSPLKSTPLNFSESIIPAAPFVRMTQSNPNPLAIFMQGFGYGKFMNILKGGLDQGIVLKDFGSIDSIIQLFPQEYRDDIKQAFQCTSIDTQYSMLNETDIEEVSEYS